MLFLIINHPLTLGLILIIQTILISLFTGIYTLIFWFSYSLFLIFIGGILILFIYITSLASNETFKFTTNIKTLSFNLIFYTILFLIIFYLFDFKNSIFNNYVINNDNLSLLNWQTSINKNSFLLNKIYNFPINLITILLVNYLFLTLIATVKITNIFKGPLRQKQI
jgi:NADH-ubiquinone oxidoreductase chain 6